LDPEVLGDDRLDLAGDDVLLGIASALSPMLAVDPRLPVEDLDAAVDLYQGRKGDQK
jgi:hypothetical protein